MFLQYTKWQATKNYFLTTMKFCEQPTFITQTPEQVRRLHTKTLTTHSHITFIFECLKQIHPSHFTLLTTSLPSPPQIKNNELDILFNYTCLCMLCVWAICQIILKITHPRNYFFQEFIMQALHKAQDAIDKTCPLWPLIVITFQFYIQHSLYINRTI